MKQLVPGILLMMAVSAAARGADGKVSSEALKCYQWFATLGFPDVGDAVFAEVWRGDWMQMGGSEKKTANTSLGYVLPGSEQVFEVVGMDLINRHLTTRFNGDQPESRVGYEKRSFQDYARRQLQGLQPSQDGVSASRGGRLAGKAQVFFLSYACWRRDEPDLAQELFDAAGGIWKRSLLESREEIPFQVSLEQDFARQALWDAVLQVGGGRLGADDWCSGETLIPRTELLESFRRLERLYPNSAERQRIKNAVSMLERMVGEDLLHPQLTDAAMAALNEEERIREWIFRLRDQHGAQQSQPGGCDIFYNPQASHGSSPAQSLVDAGDAAVPQLIEALGDERFTRSVTFHRDFVFSHRILTIGDCARIILRRITGCGLNGVAGDTDPVEKARNLESMRSEAMNWWRDIQEKGERQMLIDLVSGGRSGSGEMFERFRRKYPDDVETAVLAGASKVESGGMEMVYIAWAGTIQSEAAHSYLKDRLEKAETVEIRLAAARALWAQGAPGVVPAMIREWRALPPDAVQDSGSGFGSIADLLCASGDTAAMQAFTEGWERRTAHARFTVVEKLGQWLVSGRSGWPVDGFPVLKPQPGAFDAATALLARALEDTARRRGMNGSYGGFTFSDPRICDFALWALHNIQPEKYAFAEKGGLTLRDRERIAALNIWLGEHGLPVKPPPAALAVELPVLPPDQALTITLVEILPAAGGAGTSGMGKMAEALRGTRFTAAIFPELLEKFAGREPDEWSGIDIEASRESDLRGVRITLRLRNEPIEERETDAWRNWYSISSDNATSSGSGEAEPETVLSGQWGRGLARSLAHALKSDANTEFSFTAGMSQMGKRRKTQ